MKVLIIEDEVSAANRLKRHLQNIDSTIAILNVIESVEDAIEWLGNNDEPDLIFMDIQLSDGLSFDIFDEIKIQCPVIFTTAYNEYALKAFKVNSVDYLLKPVDPKELKSSLDKYHELYQKERQGTKIDLVPLLKELNINKPNYKTRFLIKKGKSLIVLPAASIAYFFISSQVVYVISKDCGKHILDYTLDEIENMLDPAQFFRINRQMIIAIDSILTINDYFNNRLIITTKPASGSDVIVSREKVTDFKKWLDR